MKKLSLLAAFAFLPSLGCGDDTLRDVTWTLVVSVDRDAGIRADDEDEAVVTARLENSAGLSMKGKVVEAAVAGEGASLDSPGRTNEAGVVVGRLRSTLPGAKKVSFTIDVGGTTPVKGEATVSFVDAPGLRLAFAQSPTSASAGSRLDAVRVVALDRLNRIATSFEADVELQLVRGDVAAELDGETTHQALQGELAFSDLSVRRAAEGYRLRASAAGLEGDTSDPFDITPGQVSSERSSVVAIVGEAPADGVGEARVRVTLRDAFDNPVPAIAPLLQMSPSHPLDVVGTLPPTDAAGETETGLAARSAGVRVVESTAQGVVLADRPTVAFLPFLTLEGRAEGVTGDGLVVRLESGTESEDLAVPESGLFVFELVLEEEADWTVTIVQMPTEQICQVVGGQGRMTPSVVGPKVRCGRRWMAVSEGASFTVGLTNDGALWVWGHLDYDPYMRDTPEFSSTPVRLVPGETFKRIAAGGYHAVAVHTDGSLWAWGLNGSHQVGDGTTETRKTPEPIGSAGKRFVDVSAGRHHSLAIEEGGALWAWGWNLTGQVGDGMTDNVPTPVVVHSDAVFESISAGDLHSLAIDEDGALWSWGWNSSGELGVVGSGNVLTPTKTGLRDVRSISAGTRFSVMTLTDGSLWSFGSNTAGQLGTGDTQLVESPTRIGPPDVLFDEAIAGDEHAFAVDQAGTLWSWGRNEWGQLGRRGANLEPMQTGKGFSTAAAGLTASSALGTDGSLWTWGTGAAGHSGDGTSFRSTPPEIVGSGFAEVFAEYQTSYALKTDGTLWAFGDNSFGQLGDGTTERRAAPIFVGSDFRTLAPGSRHALGLKNDGSVWAWGDSESYAYGDGTTQSLTPVRAPVEGRFKAIAAFRTSLAVREDGHLFAWGRGPVGDGTWDDPPGPFLVGGGFEQVAAGGDFVLALGADGQVVSWGDNEYSRLGDGTTTSRATPQAIDFGASRIVRVQTVQWGSYALEEDGRLWAWGSAPYPVSGPPVALPSEVAIAGSIRSFAGGYRHLLAVLDDGSLWAWGANDCGQAPGEEPADDSGVRRIELGGEVVSVAAGYAHSLAVTKEGVLWAWGCNDQGQLGVGRSVFEPRFVANVDEQ